nr:hypothetical protein [Tanacetum cinerariifolium]
MKRNLWAVVAAVLSLGGSATAYGQQAAASQSAIAVIPQPVRLTPAGAGAAGRQPAPGLVPRYPNHSAAATRPTHGGRQLAGCGRGRQAALRLARHAPRCEPPLLPDRVREAVHRLPGAAQDEHLPLASHR